MNLLYALESVRTPFWDAVFSAVTHLGEETVFMVAAILIFWCVSKQEGYYLLLMGFFGTVVNQFLKLLFRIPRPWVRDPDFTIVESARAQATGYSFPSGHTQNAVATFGALPVHPAALGPVGLRGSAAAGVLLPAVPGGPHAPGRGGVLCGGRGDGADPVSPDPPGRPQAQPDGGPHRRDAAGGHRVSGVCVCLSLPGGRGRGQPGPRAGKRLEAAGGHRGLRHRLVAGPAVYPL